MQGCAFVSTSPDRPNIYFAVHFCSDIETDMQKNAEEKLLSFNCVLSIPEHVLKSLCTLSLRARWWFLLSIYCCTSHVITVSLVCFIPTPRNTTKRSFKRFVRSWWSCEIALGMGLNLQGVNSIIHYGARDSIDDYFQESGRRWEKWGASNLCCVLEASWLS
jgi:hypothetical protein